MVKLPWHTATPKNLHIIVYISPLAAFSPGWQGRVVVTEPTELQSLKHLSSGSLEESSPSSDERKEEPPWQKGLHAGDLLTLKCRASQDHNCKCERNASARTHRETKSNSSSVASPSLPAPSNCEALCMGTFMVVLVFGFPIKLCSLWAQERTSLLSAHSNTRDGAERMPGAQSLPVKGQDACVVVVRNCGPAKGSS